MEPYVHKEIIFIVEESKEGGYEAHALNHSIYTEADTLAQLKRMIKDAVACHFDVGERPLVVRLHIVKEELISV